MDKISDLLRRAYAAFYHPRGQGHGSRFTRGNKEEAAVNLSTLPTGPRSEPALVFYQQPDAVVLGESYDFEVVIAEGALGAIRVGFGSAQVADSALTTTGSGTFTGTKVASSSTLAWRATGSGFVGTIESIRVTPTP